jgi:PIN domain nuclease of toxin-antitoxin system
VKLLLDTHCFLWALLEPERLGARAREAFETRRYPLYLSAVSSWEIATKVEIGKLQLPGPPQRYVPSRMVELGIAALPLEHSHALNLCGLPRHHTDPFDRILVAQAQLERMTLMTADPLLTAYDVGILWAGRDEPPRTAAGRPPRRIR